MKLKRSKKIELHCDDSLYSGGFDEFGFPIGFIDDCATVINLFAQSYAKELYNKREANVVEYGVLDYYNYSPAIGSLELVYSNFRNGSTEKLGIRYSLSYIRNIMIAEPFIPAEVRKRILSVDTEIGR